MTNTTVVPIKAVVTMLKIEICKLWTIMTNTTVVPIKAVVTMLKIEIGKLWTIKTNTTVVPIKAVVTILKIELCKLWAIMINTTIESIKAVATMLTIEICKLWSNIYLVRLQVIQQRYWQNSYSQLRSNARLLILCMKTEEDGVYLNKSIRTLGLFWLRGPSMAPVTFLVKQKKKKLNMHRNHYS